MGRLEEGKALLESALKEPAWFDSRAWVHGFLALAAARQGQAEEANCHLAEAREFDPNSTVTEVVAKRMAEALAIIRHASQFEAS